MRYNTLDDHTRVFAIPADGEGNLMSTDYTTDGNGAIAVPTTISTYTRVESLPIIIGYGTVRRYAQYIAESIAEDARSNPGPVVWVTGNSYFPAFRSFSLAERVWDAENNDDGELFAFLVEETERLLSDMNVALESPEYDNALYAVDLSRWQYRDDTEEADDLDDEWEPIDG